MNNDSSIKNWATGSSAYLELKLFEVEHLAKLVVSVLQPSDWIVFEGDLGAGKTTFVKAIIRHLGISQNATSPTFSILNIIHVTNASELSRICHLDLYRLKKANELLHLGLEFEFNHGSVALIEWAENVDPEGWYEFFSATRCRKPKRVASIKILQTEKSDSRQYTLNWIPFEDFAHP